MRRYNHRRFKRKDVTPYIVNQVGKANKQRHRGIPADQQSVRIQHFAKGDPRRSIFVWINTYNRTQDLYNLLGDIYKNKEDHKIKVLVVDDDSEDDYDEVLDAYVGKLNIEYHKMEFNHGKKQYWKLCTYAMHEIRKNEGYDYYVKLDDDGRLVDKFFDRCCNIWEGIKDLKKICLNFRLDSREGKKVWTNIKPVKCTHNGVSLYKSQWVDMDFFTTINFFNALRFRITRQPEARFRNPNVSSGAGRDISSRLVGLGYNLYLTTQSLVEHDEHNSHMNPTERARNPLITKPFTQKDYGVRKNG